MSNKDLQRVTESVSYIGQTVSRHSLPARRNHITQKIRIAGQRTLYLSVHDDEQSAEIFLRVKGADCSSEFIGLYDVIARLMSLALQYGAPPEKVGDLLAGAKFALCGPVSEHDLVEYCGREELAHIGTAHHVCEQRKTDCEEEGASLRVGAGAKWEPRWAAQGRSGGSRPRS